MTTIKTPAHLLKPGDRIIPTAPGEPVFVVLCAAHVNPGPVGLQLGRLGKIQPDLDRVATVTWPPMELVNVEVQELTPVQAHAGELLVWARAYGDLLRRNDAPLDPTLNRIPDQLFALLRDVEPPIPPTLEEALALLAEIRDVQNNVTGIGVTRGQRADELLDRARRTGVLPRG